MHFADYYHSLFRTDLLKVIDALPALHEHAPGEIALQPRTVSLRNSVVRRWSVERRMLFAAGLFLTVLADQVCYTHFQASYSRFRELTMYPKWRGDCPGACYYHIHPGAVFRAIGAHEGSLGRIEDLPFSTIPDDVIATMRHEVQDFVSRHMPELGVDEFWQHCEAEIPAEFRIWYSVSRFPAG